MSPIRRIERSLLQYFEHYDLKDVKEYSLIINGEVDIQVMV